VPFKSSFRIQARQGLRSEYTMIPLLMG
jgi:hypothetical protein